MTVKLARRALDPTWLTVPEHVLTYGPEVVDLCTDVGFEPDPEQALVLDLIFAVDSAGRSAAFEVDVIAARQNLKTGLILQAKLGWIFVTQQRLVVYSAHDMRAVREAFRDFRRIVGDAPALSKRLKPGRTGGVTTGSGDEAVEFSTGQRVLYKTRTASGGRALAGDKVVLDEGFALVDAHMGALLPTLAAVTDPQLIVASSAGNADSEVLRDARDRGRAGTDPRQAYVEWGDPHPHEGCETDGCKHEKTARGCALDDEDRWATIQPQLGGRITVDTVRALRQSMPVGEFAREFMVWWDEAAHAVTPVFGTGNWEACAVPAGASSIASRLTLALATTFERSHSAITAAGLNADGLLHLEPIDHARGTAWLVDRAKELQDRHDAVVVIDGRGPASSLIPALEAAGVRLLVADTNDVLDACASLSDRVQEGTARHMSYPELDAAVAGAKKRTVGDRYTFGRKSGIDITPLEAGTLAAWGVDQTPVDTEVWGFRS